MIRTTKVYEKKPTLSAWQWKPARWQESPQFVRDTIANTPENYNAASGSLRLRLPMLVQADIRKISDKSHEVELEANDWILFRKDSPNNVVECTVNHVLSVWSDADFRDKYVLPVEFEPRPISRLQSFVALKTVGELVNALDAGHTVIGHWLKQPDKPSTLAGQPAPCPVFVPRVVGLSSDNERILLRVDTGYGEVRVPFHGVMHNWLSVVLE